MKGSRARDRARRRSSGALDDVAQALFKDEVSAAADTLPIAPYHLVAPKTEATSTPRLESGLPGGLAPASPNLSPYPSALPSPSLSPFPDTSPSPPPDFASLPLHPADDPCKRVRLSEPLASKASLVALRKTFLYATSPAVFLRHASLGASAGRTEEQGSSSEEESDDDGLDEEPEDDEDEARRTGDGNGRTDSPAPRRSTRTSQRASSPRVHSPGRRPGLTRKRSKPLAVPRHPAGPSPSPAPPQKIYKRTPPSSRSDRRIFLEAQAREAAAAASAAAVMMRMNGRGGGQRSIAGSETSRPKPAPATRQNGAQNQAPIDSGVSRVGRPTEPKSRADLQIAPRASSLVTPSAAPPPYEEAVREASKDEVHPAEMQVMQDASEVEGGQEQTTRDSRRNGYLAGLSSASLSLAEAFDVTPMTRASGGDAFEDAEEALPATTRTASAAQSDASTPDIVPPSASSSRSPSPPELSTPPPQNPAVTSLRSRTVHRLASPPARPSTPDVLMQRAAAAAARDSSPSRQAPTPSAKVPVRKPSPLSEGVPEVPRRGSSAGINLDMPPTTVPPSTKLDSAAEPSVERYDRGRPVAVVGLHVETPAGVPPKEVAPSPPRDGPITRSASNKALSEPMNRQSSSSSSRRARQAGSTTPSSSPRPSSPVSTMGRPRVLSNGADQRLDTREPGRRKRSIGSASVGKDGSPMVMTRSMSGTVMASS